MIKKIVAIALCTIVSATAQAASLYDVYTEALYNDPTYLGASSQYAADSELLPQAWAALMPALSLSGSADVSRSLVKGAAQRSQNPSSTNRGYRATLELNQVLFDGAAFGALKLERKSVQASAATKAAALQDLMLRVSEAYFNVLQSEEEMRYATARTVSLERSLDQAQAKYNVGLNTITDVNLAQANYSAATALQEASKNNIATAKENLRAITGRYYDDLAPLKDDFALVTPLPLNADKWVEVALKRNWSLQAQTLSTAAAQDNISINRSGHLPTLTVSGTYQDAYNNNSISGSSRTYQPAATLSLRLPIFSGGSVVSQTRQAIANYEVADQSQEFTRRAVINSTRSNYLAIISVIEQIKADKTAIKASESALEGMNTGYKLGTQTMVDVLSAQDTLFQNQTTYATDRYNYLQTSLQLKQAAGTLQAKDLLNVDAWLSLNADNAGNDDADKATTRVS